MLRRILKGAGSPALSPWSLTLLPHPEQAESAPFPEAVTLNVLPAPHQT